MKYIISILFALWSIGTLGQNNNFNPENPPEPVTPHKLVLSAIPTESAHFSSDSVTLVDEGSNICIDAYPKQGYEFKEWRINDEIVSTENPYYLTMGTSDIHLTAVCRFNPENPGNPNSNFWDATTGEIIIDDFIPGRLTDTYYDILREHDINKEQIRKLTVFGEALEEDLRIAEQLETYTALDLKNTRGISAIRQYTFSYISISSITLPSDLTVIESYAFTDCNNLSEIICYAVAPPKLHENAFHNISESLIIRVPQTVLALYTSDPVWSQYTILPLTEEVGSLTVSLPESASDGRYKNMTLELANIKNAQKQRYILSDRMTYTFNGLIRDNVYSVYLKNHTGNTLGEIKDIKITSSNDSVRFSNILELQTIELKVLTPQKEDVTKSVRITWFDSNDAYLTQGNSLSGLIAGTRLKYKIELNQELGMQYIFPAPQSYITQENKEQPVYNLQPIDTLTVSGTVKDTDGNLLPNAVISISQQLNGKYSKAFTTQTGTDGTFKLNVYNDYSTITIAAANYISQKFTKENFNEENNLGEIKLKSISGTTISTNFTYTNATTEGGTPEIQNSYSDYENIAYAIYNITKDKAITEFSVQYPNIVLLEEVNKGDQLRITASSKNNAFMPVEDLVTVDEKNRIETHFAIVALGGINASYKSSADNSTIVGILYGNNGELIKKYSYTDSSLSINNLTDGSYTLISMSKSTFFNSILKLSQLASSGLTEGTDYVQNTVNVKSGILSPIFNDHIPELDESKLYYTGDNTSFTVNKPSIVAGNYLTLKGKIDFKEECSSSISNIQFVVDLPETCSYVENSAMVGNGIASYTLDNNRLIIPLANYTESVRFCIIPTAGGNYQPNAFVKFTLNDREVNQPIGSAFYEVKDLSISVPSTASQTTIPISGTAQGKSTIEIYDNEILIGQTTSLANGMWSTTCELNNPYNLSTHSIYAKVITEQGMNLQSETQKLMYDKHAIQASTVTMTFYNGWLKNNVEVTFDLLNGTNSAASYMFYHETDFTFIINFTDNNPDIVSDVTLYVFTDHNEIKQLKATYNEKIDKWCASGKFDSNNLPTNVSVDFAAATTPMLDSSELKDIYSYVTNTIKDTKDSKDFLDSLENKIKDELQKETPDFESLEKLFSQYPTENPDIDNETVDYLSTLDDKQFTAYIDEVYSNLDSLINDASSYSDEVENSILKHTLYGKETFVTSKGVKGSRTISDCKNIDEKQLIADGYTLLPTTDNGSIYEKYNENMYCLIDFSNNVRYLIEFTDTPLSRAETQPNRSDWFETINAAYMEFSKALLTNYDIYQDIFTDCNKNAGKKLANLLKKDKSLQEVEKALNKKLESAFGLKEIELKAQKVKIQGQRNYLKKEMERVTKIPRWLSYITKAALSVYDWKGWHDRVIGMAQKLDALEVPYCAYETKPEAAALIDQYILTAKKEFQDYYLAQFGRKSFYNIADLALGPIIGVAMAILQERAESARDKQFEASINGDISRYQKWIKQVSEKCKDIPEDDNNKPIITTAPPSAPILDPSGYVYEAVPPNRLQGVTATCYYKEMVEDMYGELHENIVLWNAAEYAQENPLFTDEQGMYAWDVPQGLWQVKFEKEGYQTTYSDWLPVPPPQLDVNIGMTQSAQPTVVAVRGFETGIEIEFSKYMQPETMTTEQIMVTRNGTIVTGEVFLQNEEINPYNNNEKFASKVRFTPTEPLATTDKVVLTVSRRVKSYAGINMESDFSQEIDIEKEAKSIVVEPVIEVAYNRTVDITVTVEPKEAAVNKKITALSSAPIIATVAPEATLDENGEATFTIGGELLGSTTIHFIVDGMELKADVKVNVLTTVTGEVAFNYYLNAGWNWLSVNVQDQHLNDLPALLEPIKASVLTLKGANGDLVNDNENGWQGSLNILSPTASFKIKMKKDATLELKGKPVTSENSTVTLNQGWNWIGYIPTATLSLEESLKNLQAEANDVIKGLDNFAIYNGTEWIGSLTHLIPGEGYMYYSKSVKSFNYSASDTDSDAPYITPQWAYDANLSEDNMPIIAELYDGEQKAESGKYLIGAFINGECRGMAVEKNGCLFITVHGEQNDEQITLRAFDTADQLEYNIKEKIDWTNTLQGSLTTPVSLHIGEATGITPVFEGVLIYPSPVRDRLFIRETIDNIDEIRISDTQGQALIWNNQVRPNEGIDVSALNKGIYVITIKTSNDVIQQKFMKID